MGWEARLFYRPLPEQAFVNVLASLSLATAEERTDLYLPHSPGAGLKLRGGDSWEVKLRVETDDRGFEKWKKHHCESEEKAVAVAGPSGVAADAPKVSVQKRRLQTSVGGCLVEQTDLLVSCGGATEEWRTVAIEGKRKACAPLLQELLLACAAQADPAHGAVRSCGYPEFVCEVAGRLSSGTRSGAAEPPATAECVLPSLEVLDLKNNQITDEGCAVLASALRGGALPALKELVLKENPASEEAQEAAQEVLRARS